MKTYTNDNGKRAMTYPLNMGCTIHRHLVIGIDAVINARAGLQHLNDLTQDEIELRRDAQRIRDRVEKRVRMYQVCSRFFSKHQKRIAHLLSRYDD